MVSIELKVKGYMKESVIMWQSLTKGIFGQVTSVTLNKTCSIDDPQNADWEFAGVQNISSANVKTIIFCKIAPIKS